MLLWLCLWFSSLSDRAEVYLGDENSLSLTFNARNEGEGGAYEAELYVVLPPEADYSGIARNNVVRQTTLTVTITLALFFFQTENKCWSTMIKASSILLFLYRGQ